MIESSVKFLIEQSLLVVPMAGLVWGIIWLCRLRNARWRHSLWFLVLLKLLVPGVPVIPLPHLGGELAIFKSGSNSGPAQADAVEKLATATPSPLPEPAAELPVGGSSTSVPWARWGQRGLLLFWLGGVVCFAVGVSARGVRVARFLSVRRNDPDLAVECEFVEMLQRLGLKRRPPLQMLAGVSQPFVWGTRGGTIYLPKEFAHQGNRRQRQLVIAHELAHVLRGDVWVNLVQIVVQAVFWFHPLVWWINRLIRIEREKACDELAVAALEAPPREYTSAILDRLAEHWEPGRPSSSLAISGGAKDLEARVRSLLLPGRAFRLPSPRLSRSLTLGLCLAVLLPGLRDAANSSVPPAPSIVDGSFHIVDLSGLPLKPLSLSLSPSGLDNSLSGLTAGPLSFQGVPFRIAGVLPLRSTQERPAAFPPSTGALAVGGRCHRVHLLAGLAGRAEEGTRVAALIFTYQDKTRRQVALRYGDQLRDWWFWNYEPLRDRMSRTFWTGSNPSAQAAGAALRLYEVVVSNPQPERSVATLELVSAGAKAEPMLLALTLEIIGAH